MDNKTILSDYIHREFNKGKRSSVGSSEDLLSNGILDSLAILQLVSFLEKQFNRSIPVEDIVYENFCSVDAIANYLEAG
ncbi:MAG TPA: acyl carrier protein [Candidatus Binatia bacterium]|jgi:acyl carrier protein|nr:acyl carrier protein [Candidatus Binatia bacterium]